jgi:hypothetical protein
MADRDDEDFDWNSVDQMGLWEHQGQPLTLRQLLRQNDGLLDLPVEVTVYDGINSSPFLTPLHVDFRGPRDAPTAVVITVAQATA